MPVDAAGPGARGTASPNPAAGRPARLLGVADRMDLVTAASSAASRKGLDALPPEDAARIRARYPRSRMNGPLGWVLVAALVAAVVGWTIWAGVHGATKKVESQVRSFHAVTDTLVEVTLDVQRSDPARGASCDVIAAGTNGIAVGENTATVAPGGQRMSTATVQIRTTGRALSARPGACHAQ